MVFFAIAVIYASLSVYQLDSSEQAVILRFGKYYETTDEGLNFMLAGIDERYVENVTLTRRYSQSANMLTKDENIVDVTVSAQYRIANLKDFVLNVKDPESSLRQATESALRHVVGDNTLDQTLTVGRQDIAMRVAERLQNYLDIYKTGLNVQQVNIEKTDPPAAVKDAFDDVVAAREDKERLQNEAERYALSIVPEARGQAQARIQDAEGYKKQVVANAEGEVVRFDKLLDEYRKAPEVTRDRLYIDAMQSVLSNSTKIMVDVEGGNNLLYLPLDKIMEQNKKRGRRIMNRSTTITVLAALILGLLINSVFIVNDKEHAIVFQFGEAINSNVDKGLNFKLPIIQNVKKYDSRLQTLDEEPDRILTVESKYLLVDSFVKYKITDVLTFYRANNGSFNSLNSLLAQRTEFELKNQFGKRTVTELVSGERDELMNTMRSGLNDVVADLGIEIIDFRVKRIDLPSNLSNAVYERMRTERNRLAEELRSEGKEIAREIRAIADKDKVVILAEAYKTAEQIRGEGDAEATGIYAKSFSQDPEFYEFTRSMKAYSETFQEKSDVMLIDSDSDFFKYLNQSKEK